MALATRCPNCSALFRVGAEQLKFRGGMVRCGACRQVFNAMGRLDYLDPRRQSLDAVPEKPAGRTSATPAPAAGGPSRPAAPVPPAAPPTLSIDRNLVDFGDDLSPRPGRHPAAPEPAPRGPDAEHQAGPATVDPGLEALAETEPATPMDVDSAPNTSFERLLDDSRVGGLDEADEGEGVAPSEPREATASEPTFLREADPRRRRAARLASAAGCLLLAPLLVAQLAVIFRASLLVHLPQLRLALGALCAPLACSAQWPMRPEFLAVVSSELQAIPGTPAMEFNGVIRNRADYPLALPALELTVTDTLNRPVARKVFLPSDYLALKSDAEARVENLPAGADLSVRLLFALPDANAAGFVAYPFYP
jgi:predicted Zn finger-like uncharacterized protein